MNQDEIHHFLYSFFTKRKAKILNNEQGLLTVKLTEKLDQKLMNRPFYWQYVKKLGYEGDPMTITFISNKNRKEEKGEWIHFGSPRLNQLFQMVIEDGAYAELYEQVNVQQSNIPLYPWHVCNFIVRYNGAYVNDELISVGILLTNGTMRFQWMDEIIDENFSDKVPHYCYKIPPIISIKRASDLIYQEIEQRISMKSKGFENKSLDLYEKEIELIDQLFQERDEHFDESTKTNHKEQIYNRLYPEVKLLIINSGLFYLSKQLTEKLLTVH